MFVVVILVITPLQAFRKLLCEIFLYRVIDRRGYWILDLVSC